MICYHYLFRFIAHSRSTTTTTYIDFLPVGTASKSNNQIIHSCSDSHFRMEKKGGLELFFTSAACAYVCTYFMFAEVELICQGTNSRTNTDVQIFLCESRRFTRQNISHSSTSESVDWRFWIPWTFSTEGFWGSNNWEMFDQAILRTNSWLALGKSRLV